MTPEHENHLTETAKWRTSLVIIIMALIMIVYAMRLFYIQVIEYDVYAKAYNEQSRISYSSNQPRGIMVDTNGNIVVSNKPVKNISYTFQKGTTDEEYDAIAEKLAELIEIDISLVSDADRRLFYYRNNTKTAPTYLDEATQAAYDAGEIEYDEYIQAIMDAIPADVIANMDPTIIEIEYITSVMDQSSISKSVTIKAENVSEAEFARVAEHSGTMPGVEASLNWDREYLQGDTLQTVLGGVTTSKQGLPAEIADYYLALGYNLNERVGNSGLEQSYEEYLRGQADMYTYEKREDGTYDKTLAEKGHAGYQLNLTIDIDFQKQVEEIIQRQLLEERQSAAAANLTQTFVTAINPQTGEVLTMAGQQYDPETNEFADVSILNAMGNFQMGSSVKPATVLSGYQLGAISPGQYLLDEALQFQGTPLKKSWKIMGNISDVDALRMSSNAYMWKMIIQLGGGQYIPNGELFIQDGTLPKLRQTFEQYGLGVETGIDLPSESTGFIGRDNPEPGLVLDFGIGQYDQYTPLQMAQYVATIANNGCRVEPYLVSSVVAQSETGNSEKILVENTPDILNCVPLTQNYFDQIKEGMRQVTSVSDGTAYSEFGGSGAAYTSGGKTGTAEAYIDPDGDGQYDKKVFNITYIGFAPFDNPEIAIAVVVPSVQPADDLSVASSHMQAQIAREVIDAYFASKKATTIPEPLS
ncbi:MAG: peptidoglycan D,D-transpeptidase FtsI family protein [Culicoidibacterales bacterium]